MKPSRTDAGVRGPLLLLLALTLVGQLNDGYWQAHGGYGPLLWQVVSAMMFSYTSFVWYCRDSDAHGYRRSRMRNIGMIFLSLLFVPVYLVRSRSTGYKWGALFRLAGFCLLMLMATVVGMLLVALMIA
jgi:hypothetical protein